MKQPEVAFCGSNRFLNDITDAIPLDCWAHVTRLENRLQDSGQDLSMTHPDVVLFEIGDGNEMPNDEFFREYPQMRFMGVDLENNYLISFFENKLTMVNGIDLNSEIFKRIIFLSEGIS